MVLGWKLVTNLREFGKMWPFSQVRKIRLMKCELAKLETLRTVHTWTFLWRLKPVMVTMVTPGEGYFMKICEKSASLEGRDWARIRNPQSDLSSLPPLSQSSPPSSASPNIPQISPAFLNFLPNFPWSLLVFFNIQVVTSNTRDCGTVNSA